VARGLLRVDRRSKAPAYLQIVEQVRALTAAGGLRPGDQLPPIRQMASEARIHFNTVARAYRILDESGLISTQHGRGTYAVAPPPARARARKARADALAILVRDLIEAAERIGCGAEDVRAAVAREVGHSAIRARQEPRQR
jgi:GntR family transcriptional regulator